MTLYNILSTIGIVAVLGAFLYIGRKLQILDDLNGKMGRVYDSFIKVEEKVESLWKDKLAPSNSPRQLNERGNRILEQSGIKDIVDEKEVILTKAVQDTSPKTAYDTELAISMVMFDLPKHCPDVVDRLKDGAFKSGESIETVLYVGSIYLRNKIFQRLGFSLDDLK